MSTGDKLVRWLASEIKAPPLSREARIEAGVLLRRLQHLARYLPAPHEGL